jgi:3-dehydroquinate synthase
MAFLLSKEIVEIATTHSKYLVTVGVDTLSLVNDNVKSKCKCVVITNISISTFYLNKLKLLLKIRYEILDLQLMDGEVYKTTDSLNLIYTFLLKNNCDRNTVLLALGGGVVGDLTGFAAATYMRGISYIQIPTTLLAMVDSSVGGKTGINHPLGKNMIGAFHQPIAVIADVSTLNTLPDRELRCGVAEIIKHACIADDQYFKWLEDNLGRLLSRDSEALIYAIKRSVEIKASIVQQDEKELGIRAILNFGHTFAHAIEAGLGFGVWLHGEAVAAGLIAAARLSEQLGLIGSKEVQRILSLVTRAGLPIALPLLPITEQGTSQADQYLKLMRLDKKSAQGNIRYIVLDAIGSAKLMVVPDSTVTGVINSSLAKN